ncbi:HMG box-containing protein 4 [Orchesella cincta]|uniref:HMG box-containing protein 4 n=1 Tax=Orchesella cincta TaxID=48709 RepID=A0A1D2MY00_ORCCI|nr:HMG box-containing protein 4 [Orchesella cincta]
MNSMNNTGDYHLGDDGSSAPESVSRSGRVRKKNSLLAVYESPDVIEKKRRKSNGGFKNDAGSLQGRSHEKSSQKGKKDHVNKASLNSLNNHKNTTSLSKSIYHTTGSYGLSHQSFGDEVPDIAGEEIVGEDLLEEEDGGTDAGVRLKSQAQSTYMLEKSFEKHRKVIGHTAGSKMKATRKDKGSPRVTAYMLWAKEQRANFAKKFPHMDFSALSKKLSDLWATVPQNQKRMWKTKAAKIMRKTLSGAENIKNSGGSSSALIRKSVPSGPLRKGMKNTTPEEIYVNRRPPGRPSKKNVQLLPPSEPTLSQVDSGGGSKSPPYISYASNSSNVRTSSSLPNNKFTENMSAMWNAPSSSSGHSQSEEKSEQYKFKVTTTDSLDVAAHLSLLGESLKKMGEEFQNRKEQPDCESLSVLLDSLLCSVGPLLCLTQKVPELDCIPEDQLKRILNNVGYVMPGI